MDQFKNPADPDYSGLEVVPPKVDLPAYPGVVRPPDARRSFWRRKWVWLTLIAVVIVAAIVGGVVGGVLGTRKSDTTQVAPTPTSRGPGLGPALEDYSTIN